MQKRSFCRSWIKSYRGFFISMETCEFDLCCVLEGTRKETVLQLNYYPGQRLEVYEKMRKHESLKT
jgi:hypothetical protein